MKKILVGAGLPFALLLFIHHAQAEDNAAQLVVKGTVYNADGTAYNNEEQTYIRFMPVTPEDPAQPWKGMFDLATNLPGYTRSTFSSESFTWLKIKRAQYMATANHYNIITTGSEAANKEIDSESQLVDLTNAPSPVNLQFQFLAPHKFITGQLVDDQGIPIAGSYHADTRTDDAMVSIRVRQEKNNYKSNYRDYAVRPDSQGRFTVAVANHGGFWSVYPYSTVSPEKFLRSIGEQATGEFANDTSNQTVTVGLTLTRVGSNVVSGRIVDSKGNPVGTIIENGKWKQSAVVYADSTTSTIGQYKNLGTDGKFSLQLKDGSFRVWAMVTRKGDGDDQRYVSYPATIITLANGQSLDLGDIQPSSEIEDKPSSPDAPKVLSVSRNEALRSQNASIKNGAFVETFSDQRFFDQALSQKVNWSNGLGISSGQTGVTAQATSTQNLDGTAVSKKFGPIGTIITSVTLSDYKKIDGNGTIQYAVSVDRKNWVTVVPGKPISIPNTWRTSKGLMWKAVLNKTSTTDTVQLDTIKVAFNFKPTGAKPTIDALRVKTTSTRANVSVKGKHFAQAPTVYVGSTKVNLVTIKGDTITFGVKRSQFKKTNYAITVVNPDFQSAVKTKVSLQKSS